MFFLRLFREVILVLHAPVADEEKGETKASIVMVSVLV